MVDLEQQLQKKTFLLHHYPIFNSKSLLAVSLLKDEIPYPKSKDNNWSNFLSEVKQAFNLQSIAFVNQVHGNQVMAAKNVHTDQFLGDADGLIANYKGLGLIVFHADCQAGFFYDPIQSVCALVHAGWRGQLKGIYTNAIKKMVEDYGSNPRDIQAAISFGLCQDHSEFINYKTEFPENMWRYKDERNHFDLKKMTFDQLVDLGLIKENILVNTDCTYENPKIFYSFRRNKTKVHHISLLALR
jgi:hypothetical protein